MYLKKQTNRQTKKGNTAAFVFVSFFFLFIVFFFVSFPLHMERARQTTCCEGASQLSCIREDYLELLADMLRSRDDILVLHPEACAVSYTAAETLQREAAKSLSLIVVDACDVPSQPTVPADLRSRAVLRGLGIIDYTLAPSQQQSQSAQTKEQWTVTLNVVPVFIVAVPWVPQLPARLRTLVCECGRFASLGESGFGSADLGPVPEGYIAREAVALVHGLPRCCVMAVSGFFPLFCPSSHTEEASCAEGEETRWAVQRVEDTDAATRDALMRAHEEKLAAFQIEKLPRVLNTRLWHKTSVPPKMWVVVSFPDGLPQRPEAKCQPGKKAAQTSQQSSRKAHKEQTTSATASRDRHTFASVSPLFLLPARFLCQHFSLHAGWQCIAREHRAVAADVANRLSRVIETTLLRASDGSVVTLKVLIHPPERKTNEPRVMLTTASALQL